MVLAGIMIILTVAVFVAGAAAAMLWFVSNGQFSDLDAAARVVLSEREPVGWEDIKKR